MGRIYFQTIAYNAEKTIANCIESVLNQTKYGDDIMYYICDNGSTDKTGEIIREYASKDARIKVFFNKTNRVWEPQEREYFELSRNLEDDDLYCRIDADDSYDLVFLEKTIPFIKENRLDIAACGNKNIDRATKTVVGERCLPEALILGSPSAFADKFPVYHQFMRTAWGKLYSGKSARHIYTQETVPQKFLNVRYGIDTIMTFSALRRSERVGIYPEPLYNYYVSSKSTSYKWESGRTESDQILYGDAEDFLFSLDGLTRKNRNFLNLVYANAITDTLSVMNSAENLTPAERLSELEKIAEYPYTPAAFSLGDPDSEKSRKSFIYSVMSAAAELKDESGERLTRIAKKYTPNCAGAVNTAAAGLFANQKNLLNLLSDDNKPELIEQLLKYIKENRLVKQYDLSSAVFGLVKDNALLCGIRNEEFLKKHGDVFLAVWQSKYQYAMELMTDKLLKKDISEEAFLILYCNLAALMERADEFVFGKIRLAVFYFSENRAEECRETLDDLEDMGIKDTEEIKTIKDQLR